MLENEIEEWKKRQTIILLVIDDFSWRKTPAKSEMKGREAKLPDEEGRQINITTSNSSRNRAAVA